MPAVHRTGWSKALVVGTAWILVAVVEIYVEPAGLWMRGHAVTDLVVTDGDRREVEASIQAGPSRLKFNCEAMTDLRESSCLPARVESLRSEREGS